MADTKISALTAATTPLAGTEVLPIVQSGVTKQVSVANLTAGRAVSASTFTSTVATGTAPFTVTSTTEVANLTAANATTASNLKSNATTGVMQIVGPGAGATRIMTIPNANFTAARTDAAQTFSGNQTFDTKITITDSSTATSVTLLNLTQPNLIDGLEGKQIVFGLGTSWTAGFSFIANYGTPNLSQSRWLINGTGQVYVNGVGTVTIANDNVVFATANKGINFTANTNASGMTSKLLNDYEEGTWTPTYTGSTSNPTVTYELQTGRYTKVGRLVTCTCRLSTSGITGAGSGNLQISGLPFTPASGMVYAGSIGYVTWWTNYPLNIVINGAVTYINLAKRAAINGTDAWSQTGDMANGNGYNYSFITISYFV